MIFSQPEEWMAYALSLGGAEAGQGRHEVLVRSGPIPRLAFFPLCPTVMSAGTGDRSNPVRLFVSRTIPWLSMRASVMPLSLRPWSRVIRPVPNKKAVLAGGYHELSSTSGLNRCPAGLTIPGRAASLFA